jgi:adenylate cyclase
MTRLSDLVRFEPEKPLQLPAWLDRIVSAGIVTSDPKLARRQRFTNVASYLGALNTASRFVQNFSHEYENFLFVQSIVVFFLVWALLIHRFHRFGDNVAAVLLAAWFLSGLSLVVILFGLQSGVQVYFATIGIFFVLYGIQQWRLCLATLAVTLAVAYVVVFYGPEVGSALPAGSPLAGRLAMQAMIITIAVNAVIIAYALTVLYRAESDLERQSARAEALVSVVLPESIAKRLRSGTVTQIADRVDGVSVLFADLSGFTPVAHAEPPEVVVAYLDDFARTFDLMCAAHGVEKIKTIGDAYMAVGGLQGEGRAGARAIANFALAMLRAQDSRPPVGGRKLSLRIGIHYGTAIAGVIGETRIAYDLWGDAVNVASRMESHGVPGRIQVSEQYRAVVGDAFAFEERGTTDIKGIGCTRTFFLLGPRAAKGA